MTFNEKLNSYFSQIGCSAKEIAQKSGISPAALSRYKNAKRVPNSDQIKSICSALEECAKEKGVEFDFKKAYDELLSLSPSAVDTALMVDKLNALIDLFSINASELAKKVNYDPSHLSRIRTHSRKPSDPKRFAAKTAVYIAKEFSEPEQMSAFSSLCKKQIEKEDYENEIYTFLTASKFEKTDNIESFLNKLNEFDLNEYIRSIKFDEIKVPTVPFQFKTSKSYFGIKQMQQAELGFLKATVLSKDCKSVFLYSDMPMTDMLEDDFQRKYMMGIALLIKKGLHIDIIHNLDRPFNELMMGLEGWIPIYMTGLVSPYYFKNKPNNVFCNIHNTSEVAALSGEAVSGYHSQGKYYLTKVEKEVKYYNQKSKLLLSKASPLMQIFTYNNKVKFEAVTNKIMQEKNERRMILSAPLISTMSDDLLKRILEKNKIDEKTSILVSSYAKNQRRLLESFLEKSKETDEIPDYSMEEFEEYPPTLSLPLIFCDKAIKYSFEDYREHIAQTVKFAQEHKNYNLDFSSKNKFRNIQIMILKGSLTLISKSNSPSIKFVIRHPKLQNAIENFS